MLRFFGLLLLVIMFIIGIRMLESVPAHGAERNVTYLAALEKVASDMNIALPPTVHQCIVRAVARTPHIVKEKALELNTVDVEILIKNGVPEKDIKIALQVTKPCLDMLGISVPK